MIRDSAFVICILSAGLAHAADPTLSAKLFELAPPKETPAAISDALNANAIEVKRDGTMLCKIWLRKELPSNKGKVEPGALLGVIQLYSTWSDFKTQEAPKGIYTLRYLLQPKSKDHEGTAPHRDFAILLPIAEDAKPDLLPAKTMIQKSGKATGGTHPVVMLLFPHPKPAAEPVVTKHGKRIAVGLRLTNEVGFGFTLIGSGVD